MAPSLNNNNNTNTNNNNNNPPPPINLEKKISPRPRSPQNMVNISEKFRECLIHLFWSVVGLEI